MIGVLERQFDTNGLLEYYKNQVFKMLGLFEGKDEYGYKFAIKVKSEIEHLPYQFPQLYNDYRFNIVISKLDILVDELLLLDGSHQFVRNHVFETMNLLDSMKEEL